MIAGGLAIAWAAVIFVLSSIPADSYPDHPSFLNNVVHFFVYFVLVGLLVAALAGGKLKPLPALVIAIIIASLYGASDEFHQYFVPGRLADPVDWMVDTLGAIRGALVATALLRKKCPEQTAPADSVCERPLPLSLFPVLSKLS